MKLETEQTGDAMVVRVCEPRIDSASAGMFKESVRGLAADAPHRVVLDLECVHFLDSSGLGAIVASMKTLAPERRLELAALTETVEKVFRLTCMDTVFTIHPNVGSALDVAADVR